MVIKSCPLLMKDTETCVGSSLASYFVLFSLISFCIRWFRFISFRFVSFLLISFRFVSFSLISFRFVSFRFYFVSHFIGTLLPGHLFHFHAINVQSWKIYFRFGIPAVFPAMDFNIFIKTIYIKAISSCL